MQKSILIHFRYVDVMRLVLNDQFGYLLGSVEHKVDLPGLENPHSLSFDDVKHTFGKLLIYNLCIKKRFTQGPIWRPKLSSGKVKKISLEIQIMGGKVCLRSKGKTLLGIWKQKICWHHLAMFCLITSRKLSRQWFEFSLKGKVIWSNPGYLLKSCLLYVVVHLFLSGWSGQKSSVLTACCSVNSISKVLRQQAIKAYCPNIFTVCMYGLLKVFFPL